MEELRRFAQDRGLNLPSSIVRKQLIEILETADKSAQFPRMLELPAELRVRIYEYHFVWFADDHASRARSIKDPGDTETPRDDEHRCIYLLHKQPPITKVCRILREESLDIFYDTITFWLVLWRFFRSNGGAEPLSVSNGVNDVFQRGILLNRVRRLRIQIKVSSCRNPRSGGPDVVFDMLLTTPKAAGELEMQMSWSKTEEARYWKEPPFGLYRARERMEKVLDGMLDGAVWKGSGVGPLVTLLDRLVREGDL